MLPFSVFGGGYGDSKTRPCDGDVRVPESTRDEGEGDCDGVASMNTKRSPKVKHLSPKQIDDLVVSRADEDKAWGTPIEVRRAKRGSFSIPPELAERAAFLARMHHAAGVEEWLARVIKERIELEEVAYAAAKQEMITKRERRTTP